MIDALQTALGVESTLSAVPARAHRATLTWASVQRCTLTCNARAVSIAPDELHRRVLSVAKDNDGLWEFARIVRDDATGQEAYDQLGSVMVELVRDGLLTIEDDRGQ